MKQYEAVIETLDKLGGVATLGELNREVFKITDCEWKTKTPFASIRRIVQKTKGIYKIKPGLYGLEKYRKQIEDRGIIVETEKNKDSNDVIMFNHTYYQGILLIIGKYHNMQTFVPKQDKNKKFYDGRKLHELSTLSEQPPYSYPQMTKRSATIDTIWFNGRNMPHSFFEIEHSTDIQNSLLKFNDLQDFYVRMAIVADIKRKPEFEAKMQFHAFDHLRLNKRVAFLSYDALIKQYEMEQEKQSFEYQFLLFPHGQYNFVPYQLSLPTPAELSLTPYDDHAISRHNTMQLIFHEKRFGIPSLFLHISYLTTHLPYAILLTYFHLTFS